VSARLENGTLRVVHGACPNLLREAEIFRYAPEEEARRTEEPLRSDNHAMDHFELWDSPCYHPVVKGLTSGGSMAHLIDIQLEMPKDLARFRLPAGVNARLQELLDRQDRGEALSRKERREAEGLVNLAELLTLLRLRAERVGRGRKNHR
jgi:hypothetical protein